MKNEEKTVDNQEEIAQETTDVSNTEKANQIVKDHTLYSMGTGIIPLPIVGLVGVMGIQVRMINELCKEYDVEFKESTAKNVMLSLAGAILPVAVAMPIASLIQFIPVIGQASGSIALSSLSSASTYTVGHYLIKHFEKSGTLEDVDAKEAKGEINKIYEKSKDAVKNMKKTFTKVKEPQAAAAE